MPTLNTNMQGKVCIVTGANSGIGKATALGLAQRGATVVMVCRDQAKGEEAQNEIKEKSGNDAVDLMLADLTSQASIRQLAENIQQHYQQLHVLINNAGVVNLKRRETSDGFETMFAVNYLAPFLLTNLLLEKLKASAPARIVNVSSDSHESGYIKMDDLQSEKQYKFMQSYGQSKLAVVLFTYELARRLRRNRSDCQLPPPRLRSHKHWTEWSRTSQSQYHQTHLFQTWNQSRRGSENINLPGIVARNRGRNRQILRKKYTRTISPHYLRRDPPTPIMGRKCEISKPARCRGAIHCIHTQLTSTIAPPQDSVGARAVV